MLTVSHLICLPIKTIKNIVKRIVECIQKIEQVY